MASTANTGTKQMRAMVILLAKVTLGLKQTAATRKTEITAAVSRRRKLQCLAGILERHGDQ
jgi:hypothetical protein